MNYDTEETLTCRYELAMERIQEILLEQTVASPYDVYFQRTARFLTQIGTLKGELEGQVREEYSLEQWKERNHFLYEDILPEHYAESFGNPEYAREILGETYGNILSFLYAELRGLICFSFEAWGPWAQPGQAVTALEAIAVHLELFLEVYNRFEQKPLPEYREIQQMIYWFVSDYSDVFLTERIRQNVDPARDFPVRIILDSDLTDLRYLYHYGEYVTENELETARYLNSLSQEEIQAMADTYTEGYRIGFLRAGKDLSKKLTVNIRYNLGFERIVRAAIGNFEKMGLKPVIFRYALSTVNKRQGMRIGYTGAVANPQFDFDHREDCALYLDKKYVERRLGVMRNAYETFKTLANGHAGPAVIEVFGQTPFTPKAKPQACQLTEKQQQLMVYMNNEAAQLTNQYILGEERSFTIIAFPVPEIGDRFEEIFRETVKINTLDMDLYEKIQQTIIDTLDQGNQVHIKGRGENRTDLVVALHALENPEKETNFENCVADVNIPVGEVFTSPKLAGTNGTLHVTKVFLQELEYHNLCLTFKDGMITEYDCTNFASKEENQAFLRSNLLYHHDTLPLGEFAIGTNTTAYAMAEKYGIQALLPILIAEKMGPHFAVGDTCYSWNEELPVYNPNGKEIIARDNEVSLLRKEDPAKAYMGCHTDITIPYKELGLLEVLGDHGFCKEIIRDGRFVLEGTEALNEPLE